MKYVPLKLLRYLVALTLSMMTTLPDEEHDALFLHILENSGYHGPFVSLTLIS